MFLQAYCHYSHHVIPYTVALNIEYLTLLNPPSTSAYLHMSSIQDHLLVSQFDVTSLTVKPIYILAQGFEARSSGNPKWQCKRAPDVQAIILYKGGILLTWQLWLM